MAPTLVINPVTDRMFAAFALQLVESGTESVEAFQQQLRARYPQAAVHARGLAGERVAIWYVYRDGHWTDPRHDRT